MVDDAIGRTCENLESQELSRNDLTCSDSSFCGVHNKPKVHRNKPMRGWFCNDCNNEKRKKWYKNDPRTVMRLSAKMRAKRDGLPFDLEKEDIVIPDVCPILGIPLFVGDRNSHDNAPTVDKIVPKLGYVVGNIQIVSYRANRIRNDATLEELKNIVAYLEQ